MLDGSGRPSLASTSRMHCTAVTPAYAYAPQLPEYIRSFGEISVITCALSSPSTDSISLRPSRSEKVTTPRSRESSTTSART